MAEPNIPSSVILHAAGFVTGGTGALGVNAANVASVVRNGAGDYTINLGTEIDPTERVVTIQPVNAAARTPTVQAETDASLQVLTWDAGGLAGDSDFHFAVWRRSVV